MLMGGRGHRDSVARGDEHAGMVGQRAGGKDGLTRRRADEDDEVERSGRRPRRSGPASTTPPYSASPRSRARKLPRCLVPVRPIGRRAQHGVCKLNRSVVVPGHGCVLVNFEESFGPGLRSGPGDEHGDGACVCKCASKSTGDDVSFVPTIVYAASNDRDLHAVVSDPEGGWRSVKLPPIIPPRLSIRSVIRAVRSSSAARSSRTSRRRSS